MRGTRNAIAALATALFIFAWAAPTEARPRPRRSQKSFEANKTFGLGIMLGSPTGLSGKYFLTSDTALDFGLGAYYGYRHDNGLHAHIDFLWHPLSLASADAFELPLYFGIGGRILTYDHDHDRDFDHDGDDELAVGVRAPIGIAMDFNRVPIDIFLELAMVVDIISHHDHVDLGAALGVRYYFN